MTNDTRPLPDGLTLGAPGLIHYDGRIYEEYLRELQGSRWRRVLLEMITQDPVIGSILFAMEMLARQATWTIQPFGNDPADADTAAFVEECLHDMRESWAVTLAEILSFIPWGWSTLELVYKRRQGQRSADATISSKFDDGKVGWGAWEPRAQETLLCWTFDDRDLAEGFTQLPPPDYRERTVPFTLKGYRKCLHFRTTSRKGNPEGVSVLRRSYRPWYFKKNIENIEGIGIERDLAGLPIAYLPSEFLSADANAAQKEMVSAVKKIVTNIRRDEQEGLVFPLEYDENGKERYKIELLSTGGTRQFDTTKIIERYDTRISMTVLADFILVGHQGVGSFALHSDKTALFAVAMGTFLDMVCETVNTQAIPSLLQLNGLPTDRPPALTHGDIETIDLTGLGAYLKALNDSGAPLFTDEDYTPILMEHLLAQAGLPKPPEDTTFKPKPPPPVVVPGIAPAPTGAPADAVPSGDVTKPTDAPKKQAAEPRRKLTIDDLDDDAAMQAAGKLYDEVKR